MYLDTIVAIVMVQDTLKDFTLIEACFIDVRVNGILLILAMSGSVLILNPYALFFFLCSKSHIIIPLLRLKFFGSWKI